MADRPSVHREVERKLRVDAQFVLVDLVAQGAVARVVPGQPFTLSAVYHDTSDLRLLRWGATLRRREGGPDAGWHLKLPVFGADRATRDELHLPLWASNTGVVPAELADVVAPLARGERLTPVAWVNTVRTPSILFDSAGVDVAELVDDQVHVRNQLGQTVAAFREIEVEARGSDGPAVAIVDRIAEVLMAHGAEPSDVSKAAAALGAQAGAPPDIVVGRLPVADDRAGEALRSIIALHARAFVLADVAVRRGLADSVHQLRVSARRLRSTLRTLEPLLEGDWARTVEEELSWLASEMGLIRDTEVLAGRLSAEAESLGDPDGGLVHDAISAVLTRRLDGARGSALAALRSERHDLLLEDLVRGSQDPPTTALADQPSGEVLPVLAERAWRRLERAVRGRGHDPQAWHRVRIRAKRVRYAVESIEPLMPTGGRRLARRLAEVTEVLGEWQDAQVARGVLREMSAREGTSPATAFALGRLSEREVSRQAASQAAFDQLWPQVRQAAKHVHWA